MVSDTALHHTWRLCLLVHGVVLKLHFTCGMNAKKNRCKVSHSALSIAGFFLAAVAAVAASDCAKKPVAFAAPLQEKAASLVSVKPTDSLGVFQEKVKAYVALQQETAKKLPKASSKSTPDKIEIYQEGLAELIRNARPNAKQGDLFSTDVALHIRGLIKDEFKGERLKELRAGVVTADTKGIPLRINGSYPEAKEIIEMPPALLLRLPELPTQLRYYFVGSNLVLMDREARIIVDYLPRALP